MAQDSLAKSTSISNFNSRRHILLYQKILYTGNQMASLLSYYDQYIGLSKAARDRVSEWESLMKRLAEAIL